MACLTKRLIISFFLLSGVMAFAQKPASIDSLESRLKGSISDSLKVKILVQLSKEQQYRDPAASIADAEQALKVAEDKKWSWARFEALRQLSFIYAVSGDYATALRYDNENLEDVLSQKDSSKIAEILNLVGNDYFDFGRYDQAYYYFTQSHRIASAIDDSLRMDITIHNVGTVFKELGQYDLAMQHFVHSRRIGEKIKDDDGLAYFVDEEADIALRKKEYQKAKEKLEESRRIIIDRKLTVIEYRTLTKFARLYLALGEYNKALAYYDSLNELQKRHNNKFGIAIASLGRSKVYTAQKKYKEAEELAKDVLATARQLHAKRLEIDALEVLSGLAEKRGDSKEALEYYKVFKVQEDSIFSYDMMQKLYQDQVRFATENKDSEIALLSRTSEETSNALKRQSFLFNIMVVTSALTVILLFSVYRSGQRRIRINKLLMEHQAEIKRRSVELEQLNQVKDKFFSIISHDLRSPMNALAGILDLAERRQLDPKEFAQLTKELRVQFNHTKTLINNLLDWTLLQMDKLKIHDDKIDLRPMVDENFKLFMALNTKETQLNNNIPQGTYGKADTNMINLVLRNLILNGIKFTESGGIITVGAVTKGDTITVSVKDNGVGIQPEVQKILFEKTSGYSTRGTANEKGTGLGLILCKEFVERNGGTIWLESQVGVGSTFYFTLRKY